MANAPVTKIARPFAQGVKLKIGADKVLRGARQWQTNAGEWYAQYGKVPSDVYDFIDAAAKDLAAGTRDWANFLKGKGRNRVTDKLIYDAAVRIETVMFLSHALKELGDNPRFVTPDGRPFVREYIAAKTAGVTPFFLPYELVAPARRVGASIYAEASGNQKDTIALRVLSNGIRKWFTVRDGLFTQTPEARYEAVPLFGTPDG